MKQVDHLHRLGRTLRETVYPSAASVGVDVNLLVIDDEADDSSISDDALPWSSPELEVFKQVPRRILDLWEQRIDPGHTIADHVFATYIAYTATPQANFLQDPDNPLAPRNFVAALRTPGEHGTPTPRSLTYRVPEGLPGWYTGADVYYGPLSDVLCVETSSADSASIDNADDPPHSSEPVVDESVLDAVRAYLVGAAIRLERAGDRFGPATARSKVFESRDAVTADTSPVTSMLIHPSAGKDEHFEVARYLREWWLGGSSQGETGALADLSADENAWSSWHESYRASSAAVQAHYESLDTSSTFRRVSMWKRIKQLLIEEIIPGTAIAVINSDPAADDRPNFEPVSSDMGWLSPPNHSTIFVAGNVMSRGLTLEGLLVTLFTRHSSAPMADTQMQMQRWFGFRGSYVDLCRVFLSSNQLSLFTQFADTDHSLRSQVLAAMESTPDSLPDFTVLQGTSFRATGKVSGLSSRQLRPGSRPMVRHLNPPGADGRNLEIMASFFADAHENGAVRGDRRGLVAVEDLGLLDAADLLDSLHYTDHGRSLEQVQRWAAVETLAGICSDDPVFPLYRAPLVEGDCVDLGHFSPYVIAAYLRFWASCLDRRVRGLITDETPPQRWSLIDLDAKAASQPRFRVALRFGSGPSIDSGPLDQLGRHLKVDIRPMMRTVEGNSLDASWGSRRATETGYVGDDALDYTLLGEPPLLNSDGSRPEGSPGLIVFQLIGRDEDSAAVAVGLSIPCGGPDHIEAVSASRRKGEG
ncbi:Z1 domain-containing protein [Ruania alba]|nr:Z1 domain-containing protein [Ruania alba]